MSFPLILADAVNTASEGTEAQGIAFPANYQEFLDEYWRTITDLSQPASLAFIAFGVICLFYGWRVFKALTIISFALLGLIGGVLLSQRVGTDNPILAIILSMVMAVVAIPLMRWAVGILGAIAGGIATSGLWLAASLPEQYTWAGTVTGVVAGGMISFIVFKIAVMLFTSMGGSALVVSGIIALLHQYAETTEDIHELFFGPKWFLPAALIIPTLIGLYWQNRFIKKSAEWTV